LTEIPPPYDIIATIKILGSQDKFVGTESNGISSISYGTWGKAYTFVDYKIDNQEDDDDDEIFAMNIELSKNQVVNKNAKRKRVCLNVTY